MEEKATSTVPTNQEDEKKFAIAAHYRDPVNGALYVHEDLDEVGKAWEDADRIPPTIESITLGSVEAWAAYVSRYGWKESTFLTWDSRCLRAVLNYHTKAKAGRASWVASYAFTETEQFRRWSRALDASRIDHQTFVELLEDGLDDIVEPEKLMVLDIVRTLRVTSKSTGSTEIRRDGTTAISFNQDAQVRGSASGQTELPSNITVRVNVFEGEDMDPVDVDVRLRVEIDSEGKVGFRLSASDFEDVVTGIKKELVVKAELLLDDYAGILKSR